MRFAYIHISSKLFLFKQTFHNHMFGFLLYGKKMAYDNKNDKLMKRVSDKNIPDYCLVKKKKRILLNNSLWNKANFFWSVNYIAKGSTIILNSLHHISAVGSSDSEGARGISKYFFLDHFHHHFLSKKWWFQDLRF